MMLSRRDTGRAGARDSVYQAALPGYAANFSRDSFTYGLLADDLHALRAQLELSSRHQGRHPDPETGEEPGKIHHELPGVAMRGLWTTYNACDTTSLFVIAMSHLSHRGDRGVVARFGESLDRAIEYLLAQSVKQAGRTKKSRPAPSPPDGVGEDGGENGESVS